MASVRDRRNVFVLAICQALGNSGRSLLLATGHLIGYGLSGDKALATLPSALLMAGAALAAYPAAAFMQRVGRRAGISLGAAIGMAGALLLMHSLVLGDFAWFNAGMLLFGTFGGFTQQYRLAAADVAPDDFKSKAISQVMAGGVMAAFIGPELAKAGRTLLGETEFLGSYAVLLGVTFLGGVLVLFVDIPKLDKAQSRAGARPLGVIMRQPAFITAVLASTIGFVVMVLLMSSVILVMKIGNGFSFDDTAFVVEWHFFAMFAPGFVTGHLINRFGILRIIITGNLLLIASVGVALSGHDMIQLWLSMVIVGVGWNLAFTGGSALLTQIHSPAERGKTQGFNEALVATSATLSVFSSGALYHFVGWQWLNLAALPLIAMSLFATLWLASKEPRPA